ncbi:MAG TPA: hemolysin family protein [Chitinolyticbacter sp.]|nr:hemolysin family protein [Chitinolyticbacter sp.]
MEILILFGLILLNGVFAMSEIALVTARRARLAKLAENGDVSAAAAIKLGDDPTRFLSTIQIGITSIGVLSGIMGEAALAEPFADWLQTYGVPQHVSDPLALFIVVAVVTYFAIVLGELVPKRIGQMNPEAIARLVSRPMEGLAFITRPFVLLLSVSTRAVMRVLGIKGKVGPSVTEDEIHAMLEEGSEAGVIEENEHALLRNVFRLDDRQIASLMIPRADIVYLDLDDEAQVNVAKVAEADYTRFPVCRGGLANVLGIVSAKDLLQQTLAGKAVDLMQTPLRPAVFVPETLTGMELLEQIRASGVEMIFVVDEYGEVQGLVTLQDVLEVITGEFMPHDTENAWAVAREDGSWLLDGLIPIPELKDKLELVAVPEEDKGRYHTLSGMMMLLLGRLPHTADIATWENWRLEVVDMDGKRIDKVLASRIVLDSEPADSDAV